MESTRPEVRPAAGAAAGRPGRRLPRPPRGDAVLAVVMLGFSTLALAGYTGATAWALLLTLALCAPLAWRRSHPEPAAGFVFAAAALQVLSPGVGPLVADAAVLLAIYALSAYGADWARPVALLVGLGGALVAVLRYGSSVWSGQDLGSALFTLVFLVGFLGMVVLVVWGVGVLRRSRVARTEAVQERARLVEVEREQQLRLVAQAERARIARDLHDVVAHSLAVMITQADGGRYAARSNPDSAVQALETIAETGRNALSEMRRLLGVLRDEAPPTSATTPQPGLEDLSTLVDGLRSGGLAVTLESRGEPATLPQGMGLAAYRIVQEGLTNVLKHAGPQATARVHLWWSPSALTVDVVDDGRGAAAVAPDDGPGHGLLGMRERAAVYGGSVQAGPMPGGGFGVRAVFPLAFTPTAMPGVRA
ncbi:sensor histidine kinase [Kineosporia sp. A_224]|uniref:sensor histidine kinase n=1 Tax=Kineosporia sp. A_224 TaxID=1962180 RepID=UPI000B4B1A4A|nr:sensor histidine kinase [Kineosporia sp. A_224]